MNCSSSSSHPYEAGPRNIFLYASPIGNLLLEASPAGLCRVCFEEVLHQEDNFRLCETGKNSLDPVLTQTIRWLDLYFDGKDPGFLPPLDLQGTPFQKTIWKILLNVPYGSACTYGALAGDAADILRSGRMAARAAGQAVHRNPVLILIPCHRVLGADGSLTGYAAGLEKKKFLLNLEKIPYREKQSLGKKTERQPGKKKQSKGAEIKAQGMKEPQ